MTRCNRERELGSALIRALCWSSSAARGVSGNRWRFNQLTTSKKIAVTERRAADLCGLSIDTLRRYRRHGIGPVYVRIGTVQGPIRYRVDDLDAWLRSNSFGSRAQELARGGEHR